MFGTVWGARWKASHSYYNGTLASFDASFLDGFCAAVAGDVKYLVANGLRVTSWGLQNEPGFYSGNATNCSKLAEAVGAAAPADVGAAAGPLRSNTYAMCTYTQCDYYRAFKACAAQVCALDPSIRK